MQIETFKNYLDAHNLDYEQQVSLKEYTTLHIGGNATFFCAPRSKEEVKMLIQQAKTCDIPYFILGNGSNVLVSDDGYDGIIIYLKKHMHQIWHENQKVFAQAGAMLWDVCEYAYNQVLTGLEFAYGIPASVGGATFMNAGAYGGELKDVLATCITVDEDGNFHEYTNEEMEFAYRHSRLSDTSEIVLEISIQLETGKADTIRARMDELWEKRQSKQPLDKPSAGSTFKRPVGGYASALIDEAGLKGFVLKRAMVSDKHAGFVVNHDGATYEEFIELIEHIKKTVKEHSGICLEEEVRILK
ncbi:MULTISPECIES: UDP-N-acetylmuramate dehydrogenase [unclassified Breznakia]|uniref:UDP-N-acetylmuramate dehydrogenase n=1 Tax=unclassified Breznakia TaxID=2623764 RepID=UPI002475B230|nr:MULTISPECIES: UDP-N-acetylmuramate dehydrogenase [unclassified Breznakia]MDH6368131.1 UDP-N-acetylmuramate dehydrogenase [Breznakia sp. PH1-1]MDH6405220.1 UDP-N-acetylmuramate dehydrogenase [Breznakia sp. PF1-11]MDH6412927.1 UDP-N-acetylmuramate dehydrogenase [Breznakia sp. PFB1-11]MDH6415289.1 UDP-N-acetylmuramate dehydrogenase [Breznakia sp. PFB1-14]MDH6417605.1 UDP-N-acetylmuramate dehydrogenase [Breznakia sp. PFB1-4]